MKQNWLLCFGLLFLLSGFRTSAQVVAVSNMRKNVVYLGINNDLRIVRENTPCNSLNVSTDNGSIKKSGPCNYDYRPARLGMAQIVVRSGKGSYNYLLRVEGLGVPEAYVASWRGGMVPRKNFEVQVGLYAKHPGIDKTRYTVTRYSYQIIRDDKAIAGRSVNSNKFEKDVKEHFSHLQKNDKILFYNIVVDDGKSGTFFVAPIEFTML